MTFPRHAGPCRKTERKFVGWQWMSKYSLMREIKRLELQVAELARERKRKPESDVSA